MVVAWLDSRSKKISKHFPIINERPLAVRAAENAVVAVDIDCDMDGNFDLRHYPL